MRSATFALWLLAAASAVYWGIQLSSPSSPGNAVAPAQRQAGPGDPAVVARLLGHSNASPAGTPTAQAAPAASRFALVGVVADRAQQGAALIAVDGRPARPYRVGSRVDESLVLQSVQPRRAVLGHSPDGPAVVTLEMPAPASR